MKTDTSVMRPQLICILSLLLIVGFFIVLTLDHYTEALFDIKTYKRKVIMEQEAWRLNYTRAVWYVDTKVYVDKDISYSKSGGKFADIRLYEISDLVKTKSQIDSVKILRKNQAHLLMNAVRRNIEDDECLEIKIPSGWFYSYR